MSSSSDSVVLLVLLHMHAACWAEWYAIPSSPLSHLAFCIPILLAVALAPDDATGASGISASLSWPLRHSSCPGLWCSTGTMGYCRALPAPQCLHKASQLGGRMSRGSPGNQRGSRRHSQALQGAGSHSSLCCGPRWSHLHRH
jgi:hypothetical protein